MNDDELRALYAAARAEEAPTLADRRIVRNAVRSAVTAAAATTAATASAAAAPTVAVSAITAGKIMAWVGIGFALGAMTSAGAVAVRSGSDERGTSTPSAAVVARESASKTARESVQGGELGLVLPSPASSAPSPVVSEAAARLPDPSAGVYAGAPMSLAHEADALARVQNELAQGNPTRALALLNDDDRRFERGALAEERAAARVVALCASGERGRAENARAAFLKRYPRSPLGKRVLGTCND